MTTCAGENNATAGRQETDRQPPSFPITSVSRCPFSTRLQSLHQPPRTRARAYSRDSPTAPVLKKPTAAIASLELGPLDFFVPVVKY